MAYDSTLAGSVKLATPRLQRRAARIDDDFHRTERMVVVCGAVAFGAVVGTATAFTLGYTPVRVMVVAGAPIFLLGLYFAVATLRDAIDRRAWGCASATMLHFGALLTWPVAAVLYPLATVSFWFAPALAVSALILFASCWSGAKRVVYRACAQGALMAVCAAYFGVLAVMGA